MSDPQLVPPINRWMRALQAAREAITDCETARTYASLSEAEVEMIDEAMLSMAEGAATMIRLLSGRGYQ